MELLSAEDLASLVELVRKRRRCGLPLRRMSIYTLRLIARLPITHTVLDVLQEQLQAAGGAAAPDTARAAAEDYEALQQEIKDIIGPSTTTERMTQQVRKRCRGRLQPPQPAPATPPSLPATHRPSLA